jgi:LDH2 family malate/lactate/ureidoglycolate dehydrogenase
MHYVSHCLLEQFMADVFMKVGVPEPDARICANVLITSDKRGIDSHGIGRFKPIYIDRIKKGQISPVTNISIVRESPGTVVIDGGNGMGQVIAKTAMQMAIDKAKKYGIGMAVVRNSNHYGIAGYYVLMAIEQYTIGITGTNARPSIAPTFGVENMLGTNAFSFGFPSDEEFPFVLDCATSITQRGKIETYSRLGLPMPEGWVIGQDGKPRTDTDAVLKDLVTGDAALLPLGGMDEDFAGYKGYGYATVVEILSASLQQGAFLRQLTGMSGGKLAPYHLGHFFIAIDIAAFCEVAEFRKTTGAILRDLRNSKKKPDAERIYTAGEKEHLAWLKRKAEGIPIDEVVQKEILELKKEFHLDQYHFPFE